ncbi:hypothetical protein PR048_027463 [Dryococelus australis]|uniref:Uncharacterized protein n=1 Tax=Dryococelus australis TaxID=614101 RepID=A0ABQ9GFN5_9NEOP|nr:hypothetical protein PR048_027463 [Dryococelus australis]
MPLRSKGRKIVELVLNKNEGNAELSCGNGENEYHATNKSIVVDNEVKTNVIVRVKFCLAEKGKKRVNGLGTSVNDREAVENLYLNDKGSFVGENCNQTHASVSSRKRGGKTTTLESIFQKRTNVQCLTKEAGNLLSSGYSLEMSDENVRGKTIATKKHFAKDQKASGTDVFLYVSFDLQKVLNNTLCTTSLRTKTIQERRTVMRGVSVTATEALMK